MTSANPVPAVHIYELSRLATATPGHWERMLKEMEEGKNRAFLYYQPVRDAIVRLCAGRGASRDLIVSAMLQKAHRQAHSKNQTPEADNLRAFEVFERAFLPLIAKYEGNFLRSEQQGGVRFEGVDLFGLPHMRVTDQKGNVRYIFLYPSNWKKEELRSYLELLTFVIEQKLDGSAANLWCMNLRTGRTVPWPKSSKQTRRLCADTAKHYCRLVRSRD